MIADELRDIAQWLEPDVCYDVKLQGLDAALRRLADRVDALTAERDALLAHIGWVSVVDGKRRHRMDQHKLLLYLGEAQQSIGRLLSLTAAEEGWHRRRFNKTGVESLRATATALQASLHELKRQYTAISEAIRLLQVPRNGQKEVPPDGR